MQSDSSPDMEAHKPIGEFFCWVWKETVMQLQGNPIHTSNSQQMHSLSACLMEDDPNSCRQSYARGMGDSPKAMKILVMATGDLPNCM